jgi:hypothetical protein
LYSAKDTWWLRLKVPVVPSNEIAGDLTPWWVRRLFFFAFDVFLAGTAMSFPTFFHFFIMHAAAMHFFVCFV